MTEVWPMFAFFGILIAIPIWALIYSGFSSIREADKEAQD